MALRIKRYYGERRGIAQARFGAACSERNAGRNSSARSAHGHFTTGGSDDRIESTLPPVRRPKIVPRS